METQYNPTKTIPDIANSLYLVVDPSNKVTDLKIGIGVIGFATFIRQVAGLYHADKPIPRSWLVRYDLPKHIINNIQACGHPSEVSAEIARAKLFPTQIIPLPKAVFCEQQRINCFTNFSTPLHETDYMKFQKRQSRLRSSLEESEDRRPSIKTNVKIVPVQSPNTILNRYKIR